MTHERAYRLAAALRHLDAEQVAEVFPFSEVALDVAGVPPRQPTPEPATPRRTLPDADQIRAAYVWLMSRKSL